MTLEESSVIVANLLRVQQPQRKASRSVSALSSLTAHTSGSTLRSKKRDSTVLDQESLLSFQFQLENASSSSAFPSSSSSYSSSMDPALFNESMMTMESFQSLSGSGAPVVAFASSDYIDPSLVFTSDVSELISTEEKTSRLEDVESDAIAVVEPVIPPKRSHRTKDGSRVRDRKRSRTKITPKRATVGGGGGGGGVKDTSSSSPPVKGNEATRAGVKMSAAKTAAAAAVAVAAAAVEDDEEEDSTREILTALSPMEFCPLGQFPGSGSPMLVTSREGATPRGSSAAFVLLTTKSSLMTTLASPKPLPATSAAMSSSLLSLSSADKSITSSPSRVLPPSPLRSSPLGGSPLKVQQSDLYHSSASSTVEVNHALEGSSSSSSSPLVLPSPPLPRSSRRMRAQVQFMQKGDEPDEEILVLLSSSS